MSIGDRIKGVKNGFAAFLLKPEDYKLRHLDNAEKFKDSVSLVVLELAVIIPLGILIYFLDESGVITIPEHMSEEMMENMSFLTVLFYVAVLAPILEEFIFRTFIVLRRFYPLLFFIAILESFGKSKFSLLKKTIRGWKQAFPIVVVLSSLLFGYIHIWNFKGDVEFWLVPVLVLPQVISGFFLAYGRVRYGLIWSILQHALFNLLLIILEYTVPIE